MKLNELKILFLLASLFQILSYSECNAAHEIQIYCPDLSTEVKLEYQGIETVGVIKNRIYDFLSAVELGKNKLLPDKNIFWKSYRLRFIKEEENNSESLYLEDDDDFLYEIFRIIKKHQILKKNIKIKGQVDLLKKKEINTYCDGKGDLIQGELNLTCYENDSIYTIKKQIFENLQVWKLNNKEFDNPSSLTEENITFEEFWNDRRLIAENFPSPDVYLDYDEELCFSKILHAQYLRVRPFIQTTTQSTIIKVDTRTTKYLSDYSTTCYDTDTLFTIKKRLYHKLCMGDKNFSKEEPFDYYWHRRQLVVYNDDPEKGINLDDNNEFCFEKIKQSKYFKTSMIPTTIDIYLRTLGGETLRISILETTTVGMLKNMIRNQNQIPVNKQSLLFAGRNMRDKKTLLGYYDVTSEGCIHLIINKQVSEEVSKPLEEIKKTQADDITTIKPTAAPLAGNELEQRFFQLHQALVQLKQKLMMLSDGLNKIAHKLSGQKNNMPTKPDDIDKRIQDLFLQAKTKPEIIIDPDAQYIFSHFIVNINSYKNNNTLIKTISESILGLVNGTIIFLHNKEKQKDLRSALLIIQSFLQTLKNNNLLEPDFIDLLRKNRQVEGSSGSVHADILEFIDTARELLQE